jgi:hypothetical protein
LYCPFAVNQRLSAKLLLLPASFAFSQRLSPRIFHYSLLIANYSLKAALRAVFSPVSAVLAFRADGPGKVTSSLEVNTSSPEVNASSPEVNASSTEVNTSSPGVNTSSTEVNASSLGEATSGLGEASSDLGEASSDLGEASVSLGEATADLGEASSDLGEAFSDLGEASSGLGEASSGLGEATSGLEEASVSPTADQLAMEDFWREPLAKEVKALQGDNEKSKRTANKTEKREKVCLPFACFRAFRG